MYNVALNIYLIRYDVSRRGIGNGGRCEAKRPVRAQCSQEKSRGGQ